MHENTLKQAIMHRIELTKVSSALATLATIAGGLTGTFIFVTSLLAIAGRVCISGHCSEIANCRNVRTHVSDDCYKCANQSIINTFDKPLSPQI